MKGFSIYISMLAWSDPLAHPWQLAAPDKEWRMVGAWPKRTGNRTLIVLCSSRLLDQL